MNINLISIVLYFIASVIFPAEVLNAMLAIHCAWLVYDHIRLKKKISPIFLYYVYVSIVSVCDILLINDYDHHRVSAYSYFIDAHSVEASLIWCLGNVFIFIGYQLAGNLSLPSVKMVVDNPKTIRYIFYAMLVLTLRRLFISDQSLGSIVKILSLISSVGIIFFARLWGKSNSRVYRSYAIILCVAQTIFALLFAYLRQEFIVPTICLFIGYFIGRESFRELFSYRLIFYAGIAVLFSFAFNYFGQNRTSVGTGLDRVTDIVEMQDAPANDPNTEPAGQKGGVISRMSNLAQLTNVVDLVKKKGFYDGAASAPLIISLVPRFLWPDKPIIAIGAWFAVEIGQGYISDKFSNNSINMTVPGELYLDFGWLGVAIGCLLVGILLASFWNATHFYDSPYNIGGILYGGYLLISSFTGIGADLQIIITFVSIYILFLIVKKLI